MDASIASFASSRRRHPLLGPPKARDLDLPVLISLEAAVPQSHFYRHLHRVLDLSFVRDLVADCSAAGGRPSVDPVVYFKLQLVMFFEDIRSERQLMQVVADRLSLRWYLGYDLHERLPDHSSLTKIRGRYGLSVFRRFFETITARCVAAGLVWGKELYVDATKVEANAARASLVPRFAVEAHLRDLFKPDRLAEPAIATTNDATPDQPTTVAEPPPIPLPVPVSEEQWTVLAGANAQRHDWLAQAGKQQREVQNHHFYQRLADYVVSTTDPDATFMHRPGSSTRLGYQAHDVVDGGKARIILQALVAPAEVMEGQPMRDLVWHTCFHWQLRPRQVTADTAYAGIENIIALEDAGIRAYLPLPAPDRRRIGFSQQDFRYDPLTDTDTCPQGTVLKRRHTVDKERSTHYQAPATACNACPCKARCTPSNAGRTGSAVWMRHTSSGCEATMRRRHTRRQCANAGSGSNRSSPKRRDGMAYGGSGCVGC
jgi:transposase